METGIFLRGVLVGTKDVRRDFTDAHGVKQVAEYIEMGVEVEYTNSFGRLQKSTVAVRISEAKARDSAFMKSLNENHLAFIEVPVNNGNFKSLYLDQSATLNVITSANAA